MKSFQAHKAMHVMRTTLTLHLDVSSIQNVMYMYTYVDTANKHIDHRNLCPVLRIHEQQLSKVCMFEGRGVHVFADICT